MPCIHSFIHSFISSPFHFITWYVPHDTYVIIVTRVVKHHLSPISLFLPLSLWSGASKQRRRMLLLLHHKGSLCNVTERRAENVMDCGERHNLSLVLHGVPFERRHLSEQGYAIYVVHFPSSVTLKPINSSAYKLKGTKRYSRKFSRPYTIKLFFFSFMQLIFCCWTIHTVQFFLLHLVPITDAMPATIWIKSLPRTSTHDQRSRESDPRTLSHSVKCSTHQKVCKDRASRVKYWSK